MMDVQRWFQPASTEVPNTNEWHAYRESSPEGVCGEVRINYNIDPIADVVPESGKAHQRCLDVLSGKQVEAAATVDAVIEKPKGRRGKTK